MDRESQHDGNDVRPIKNVTILMKGNYHEND